MWLGVIDHIEATFVTEPQPVPNYLSACGGRAAIQRVIDAPYSAFSGGRIYHPQYILHQKFALADFCLLRKNVFNGVRICTVHLHCIKQY